MTVDNSGGRANKGSLCNFNDKKTEQIYLGRHLNEPIIDDRS